MATDKQNRKKGITPEKVVAWGHKKAGLKSKESAQILGVSIATVDRYRAEMEDFVGRDFDVQVLRNNLLGMYGIACEALRSLLEDKNAKTVTDYFNGLGIWSGKHEFDIKDTRDKSTEDLIDEFTQLTGYVPGGDEESEGDSIGTSAPN